MIILHCTLKLISSAPFPPAPCFALTACRRSGGAGQHGLGPHCCGAPAHRQPHLRSDQRPRVDSHGSINDDTALPRLVCKCKGREKYRFPIHTSGCVCFLYLLWQGGDKANGYRGGAPAVVTGVGWGVRKVGPTFTQINSPVSTAMAASTTKLHYPGQIVCE